MTHPDRPTDESYGYVATQDIRIGGALAFATGDRVPTDTVERAGSPIDPATVTKVGSAQASELLSGPERPAGNAGREEWAAYALQLGASEDQVAGMTRDQLRSQWGG